MKQVLVIKNERSLAKKIVSGLKQEGYFILTLHNENKSLNIVYEQDWDIIVLDWDSLSISGPEICRQIRAVKTTPIIIVTDVAMVLCQETEYVLLDEPLNNLDVARSVQMMEHLRRAANEFGRTILTVMHDINFAAKYSDRICAMKDGQIAAFGTVEEIMDSKILTDIFETKIEIIEGPYGPIAVY